MARRTFFTDADDGQPRCRVCGNPVPPRVVRRPFINIFLVFIVGVLLAWVVADIADDGRLDGSIFATWTGHTSCGR